LAVVVAQVVEMVTKVLAVAVVAFLVLVIHKVVVSQFPAILILHHFMGSLVGV
jgi:hypothetical protein